MKLFFFFFAIHTSELCLFFLWVFSRTTSDFTLYSGKAPFSWLAPQHCPPQDPFRRFVHRRGLSLVFTLLKRDCVSEWLGQEHGGASVFPKPFEKGAVLRKACLAPGPGSRPVHSEATCLSQDSAPRSLLARVYIICAL